MTREEVVEKLAKERVVEHIACSIAKSPLTPLLQDLSQIVYLILLEYDESKIIEMSESGALRGFIIKVIKNQYLSTTSPFYKQVRRFSDNAVSLSKLTYDAENE